MDQSWALDWSAALPALESAANLYVVGRGLGLGAAQEIALKCKETCGIACRGLQQRRTAPWSLHACSGQGFPALLLAQRDATRPGIEALAIGTCAARRSGAARRRAMPRAPIVLPTIDAVPEIAPMLLVQSAYRMIATLAVRRGLDPDHPPHLRKVTETV